MLLEIKSYGRIRRKAYNVDNPVQAKHSSGCRDVACRVSTQELRCMSGRYALTPSCAVLARGYHCVRPSVLLLKKYVKTYSLSDFGHALFLLFVSYQQINCLA